MFLIRGLIVVVLTISVACFSILNLQMIDVFWNPIDADLVLPLPLYVVVLAALTIGFVVGSLLVWINLGNVRQDRRRQKRDIQLLEKEVARLKDLSLNARTEDSTVLAVLPSK